MTLPTLEELQAEYNELYERMQHVGHNEGEADALQDAMDDIASDIKALYPEPTTKYFDELPEETIVYVNAYRVTREYGGPEEGGWYFNRYECIEIFPTRNNAENVETIAEMLESHHEHEAYGDITSVLGGQELAVRVETKPKETETTEQPRYE